MYCGHTFVGVPTAHRLLLGGALGASHAATPWADPHTLMIGLLATQLATTPPCAAGVAVQLQLKPVAVVVMAVAWPVAHRAAIGAVDVVLPLAVPHAPLIARSAVQATMADRGVPGNQHDHSKPLPVGVFGTLDT